MKISVLTPTYNDGISLGETVESLLSQTYDEWEWIVVNDGSTDNTDIIVKELIEKNYIEEKCTYIKQDNKDQLNALLNGAQYITGDYVFVLHSDDLLPADTFFSDCVSLMELNPKADGLFGDLVIIDENSNITGMQRVNSYKKDKSVPPQMLLWLGRNLYADVAFHKKDVFLEKVKHNYLEWNMPFWLYYDEEPKMLNYINAGFPLLKYRVHGENYINNEVGMHNVLNGELRTAIKLMHYFDVPNYEKQYFKYRLFNKIKMSKAFKLKYYEKESVNKAKIIDFIIKKRFDEYDDKLYFSSIYHFYYKKNDRTLDLSFFSKDTDIFCGKDVRKFNEKLLSDTLDESYMRFMREMQKGFSRVINYEHLGEEKLNNLLKFFCIEEEVIL